MTEIRNRKIDEIRRLGVWFLREHIMTSSAWNMGQVVHTIKRRRDFFTSRLRLRRCEVIKMDSKDNQPMDRYPTLTAPLLLSLRLALSTLPLYVNIPRILHRQAGNAFGLFFIFKDSTSSQFDQFNSLCVCCVIYRTAYHQLAFSLSHDEEIFVLPISLYPFRVVKRSLQRMADCV